MKRETAERLLGVVLWALGAEDCTLADGGCILGDDIRHGLQDAALEAGAWECEQCGSWSGPNCSSCDACADLEPAEIGALAALKHRERKD